MQYRLLTTAFILLCCAGSNLGDEHVYRIGNSLTWDSQPSGIQLLAAQRKEKHVQAWHINCGKSLQRIWSMPEEICVKAVAKFGMYRDALPNHDWTAVTFQPHPGGDSTLGTDASRIVDMIKLTQSAGRNSKTVFYIYAAWPGQPLGEYRDVWTRDTPDKDDTKTIQTRDYFAHLYKRVRRKTKADVRMIPAGHVVFELDKQIRAGKIEGYKTAADLYRDNVHMNHVGRYTAGVTTLTTITGKNPKGLTCPAKAYGGGKDFNANHYKVLHDAIWKVVTEMKDVTGVK